MFKNRSIQMKFVKDADNVAEAPEVTTVDPEQIAKIAKDYTVMTVGAIGAAIAANKIVNTICEIAVIAAKAKLK
jgi:hypothetical protein